MKTKYYLIGVCLVLKSYILFGQKIDLVKLTNDTQNSKIENKGIIYSLPKTVIILDVEIAKTSWKKPKNKICDPNCLQRLNMTGIEVISKNKTEYKIRNYSISTNTKVDEDHIYIVNPKKKWNKNKEISFSLSTKGIIQGANVTIDNQTFNIVSSTISSVISAVSLFALNNEVTSSVESEVGMPEKRLINLIKSKEQLLALGTYSSDLTTMQYQILELNKLIALERIKLFGEKETKTATFRFEIDLSKKHITDLESNGDLEIPILKIIKNKGIWLSDNTKSTNKHILYPEDFLNDTEEGKELNLKIENWNNTLVSKVSELKESQKGSTGLAYRIPKNHLFTILLDSKEELKSIIPLAQTGSIMYLPKKMDKANIEYYGNYGSLKSLVVSSSAFNTEVLEKGTNLISDAKTLIDGENGIDKLTKEVTELELKIRKRAAKEQLKNTKNDE